MLALTNVRIAVYSILTNTLSKMIKAECWLAVKPSYSVYVYCHPSLSLEMYCHSKFHIKQSEHEPID